MVVQQDKHFPYLTCRETLKFAAELYNVAPTSNSMNQVVEEIIDKMGLRICADTRNARLSGGQARRLSIGIALLKQPTLLFLDEPTSGTLNRFRSAGTKPSIKTYTCECEPNDFEFLSLLCRIGCRRC